MESSAQILAEVRTVRYVIKVYIETDEILRLLEQLVQQ